MDVLAACLRKYIPTPGESLKNLLDNVVDTEDSVPTGCRDTGIFFLGHASRPSMARSVAGYPAGSRPQQEDTRIPPSVCGFWLEESV